MNDEDLLIKADSLLSLIRYREASGLSTQTLQDIDALMRILRQRTDDIVTQRRKRRCT